MTDLDAAAIERELRRLGARVGAPCTVLATTASTNDDAKRAAAVGAPSGASFIADEQTAGRGRLGHTWQSPRGENLYLSVIVRPRVELMALSRLTLVVGLAATRAIEPLISAEVRIKWPNDLYVGSKKVAGVLVEASLRGGELGAVIVGVGVNVHARVFPPSIARHATSLALSGAEGPSRSIVAARLLREIGEAVDTFEQEGIAPSLEELRARDALRGCEIEVSGRRGVAAGIDDEGRLLVRYDGLVEPLSAGEPLTVDRSTLGDSSRRS